MFFRKTLPKLILALLLGVNFAYSQGSADQYLYVYSPLPNAIPDNNGNVSDTDLQQILNFYDYQSYSQSFLGAQSSSLLNVYEIHLNGNPYDLKADLDQLSLFSLVEVVDYMKIAQIGNTCKGCDISHDLNDPNIRYELDLPGYPCAWEITEGSPDVTVAVVDTDFDQTNPELANGLISVWTPPNYIVDDCGYHGNIVSGVIIAQHNNNIGAAGVAPGVKVAGYRVRTGDFCNANGDVSCSGNPWSSVWQAYLDGHKIINVSWSGVGSTSFPGQAIVDAVTEMTESGVLLVVAAGNTTGGTSHSAYSNIPGVINVSSVSADGTPHNGVSFNQWVDFLAPGEAAGLIDYSVCNDNWTLGWGTSLSAPNAAGAAALIRSVNNCILPEEIEAILEATACPLTISPLPNTTGAGYLNAEAAVQMAQGFFGSINSSSAWNDVHYVSDDVIVEDGVTLTINGEVKIAEGKRIIIEKQGRVILNGKLTSSCANPWGGILINGFNSVSQYVQGYHGYLSANNGSIIENAEIAVDAINGGRVYANGATFLNNGIGIRISPYNNFWPFPAGQTGNPVGYFSNVRNCIFKVNDEYSNSEKFESFIDLNGIRGIPMVMGLKLLMPTYIFVPLGKVFFIHQPHMMTIIL